MTLTTVAGSNQPVRVIAAGDGPGVLVNRDLTNVAYTSPDAGFNPADVTASIHDPLVGIPYDGDSDVWACVQPGVSIQMDFMENASNWAPSPAQAAQQIATLGLATATNQNLANLVSQGISNATQAINGNHIGLQSMVGNPFFSNPNGNADASGWAARQGSFQTAGISGAVALPGGSGQPNGIFFTANGSGAGQFQWGPPNAASFPVSQGQICNAHFLINAQSVATPAFAGFAFFNSAGTFLSTLTQTSALGTVANTWQKVFASVAAPGNAAFATPVYGLVAPVLNATYYATAAIAYAVGSPGTTPNDHAQAIAVTGAPNLAASNQLATITSATALNATTTIQLPAAAQYFPVNQPSYDGTLTIHTAAAGPLAIEVILTWADFDPVNSANVIVNQDTFWIYCGSAANNHAIFFKGPTKGSLLNIALSNNTGSNATIDFFVFLLNSRVTLFDRWTTLNPGSANVFPGVAANGTAPFDLSAGIVCAQSVSVGIGATNVYALPIYNGKVNIRASSASGTNDAQVFITQSSDSFANLGNVYNQKTDATGVISISDLYLPRAQCILNLRNTNAAAKVIECVITAADY